MKNRKYFGNQENYFVNQNLIKILKSTIENVKFQYKQIIDLNGHIINDIEI